MATLERPHWETVGSIMRDVLTLVDQQPFARRVYLAGGTALALQIGHRRSVDLDFFSQQDELLDDSRREIVSALRAVSHVEVREDTIGNLLLHVNGVSTGFFGYGYPVLGEVRLLTSLRLASIADIALMKLDAIITRGARKDFIDLFFALRSIDSIGNKAIHEVTRRSTKIVRFSYNCSAVALPGTLSHPRKRVSSRMFWIPACAGMTGGKPPPTTH